MNSMWSFFFLSGSKNARQIKRLPLTIPNESLKSPTLCEFLFWFLIIFVEFKRQGLFLFTFSNVFFSLFCYRNFLFRTEESQKYNTYASKTRSLRSFYKSEISTKNQPSFIWRISFELRISPIELKKMCLVTVKIPLQCCETWIERCVLVCGWRWMIVETSDGWDWVRAIKWKRIYFFPSTLPVDTSNRQICRM